ncbi:glycosyltransferase [Roseateles sp. SL47]|uniref:glycosyltransferase n=1 Tax=Roseateles sp. SL47 TaxID=2995138 RepID=UPI00227153E6|nr:glycosyltransferase [Roseateles sp. SL47]WAC72257.1 glycosyltransferase [Roseateles sp. SL47]
MMGVVVPAHDEEALIGRCLQALRTAAQHPDLQGEAVQVLVVLDACSDGTAEVARQCGVLTLPVNNRNVGMARAAGALALIERGAHWLAFTDADSAVAPCWLAQQALWSRSKAADAVCGVVAVDDWQGFSLHERQHYESLYADREGHAHVHGASFGISAEAYLRTGGFAPLACHEDADLVRRLTDMGATIARTNKVRAYTSARRMGRIVGGFASYLNQLAPSTLGGLQGLPDRQGR